MNKKMHDDRFYTHRRLLRFLVTAHRQYFSGDGQRELTIMGDDGFCVSVLFYHIITFRAAILSGLMAFIYAGRTIHRVS
jgi:hypothetical protein